MSPTVLTSYSAVLSKRLLRRYSQSVLQPREPRLAGVGDKGGLHEALNTRMAQSRYVDGLRQWIIGVANISLR